MQEKSTAPIKEPEIEIKPESKKISRKEMGKLRRRYWTVTLGRVTACGHKFNHSGSPPDTNCEDCWYAYFKSPEGMGENLAELTAIVTAEGPKGLERRFGSKFVKQFSRFLDRELNINQEEQCAETQRANDTNETQSSST